VFIASQEIDFGVGEGGLIDEQGDQFLPEQASREGSDEGALASEFIIGEAVECLGAEAAFFVDEGGIGLNDASQLVLGDVKSHLFGGGGQNDRVHQSAEGLAVEVPVCADLVIRIAQLFA